uniref:Putative ovule protein n=1 Tax=Solanum chacoense TaxID=4108 RepID=A0A0V0H0M7_SOLCH
MEIEFGIDTLPGMRPIFIPPYRMVLAELNQLKRQLQDLLDKGLYSQVLHHRRFSVVCKEKGCFHVNLCTNILY